MSAHVMAQFVSTNQGGHYCYKYYGVRYKYVCYGLHGFWL